VQGSFLEVGVKVLALGIDGLVAVAVLVEVVVSVAISDPVVKGEHVQGLIVPADVPCHGSAGQDGGPSEAVAHGDRAQTCRARMSLSKIVALVPSIGGGIAGLQRTGHLPSCFGFETGPRIQRRRLAIDGPNTAGRYHCAVVHLGGLFCGSSRFDSGKRCQWHESRTGIALGDCDCCEALLARCTEVPP
jgi:hypothetical protein